jgi:two-component system chemotaxis response regulator CheY
MSKALIVDDSRAMRMILRRTLEGLSFEVREAENGTAALDLLAGDADLPSLILVDWNMPGLSGIEVIKQLRVDKRFQGTAVMMVTTETSQAQMIEALRAGADEYLMKPFTPDAILDKLRLLGIQN